MILGIPTPALVYTHSCNSCLQEFLGWINTYFIIQISHCQSFNKYVLSIRNAQGSVCGTYELDIVLDLTDKANCWLQEEEKEEGKTFVFGNPGQKSEEENTEETQIWV